LNFASSRSLCAGAVGVPREEKRSYLPHFTPEFASRRFLGLTVTSDEIRIAARVPMCSLLNHACPDCDVPGEGSCSRCHGKGKIIPDKSFGRFRAEITCPLCKGNGACPTCGGTGVAETGGESG
jgi:hypothetical protein